ncbi:MAG: 50S ribosomal protein L29 [Thaumarchaeota archaeon]|nr:50S ribosomal protein L29 [Nitrososphaerota archaeon]MCY3975649.1 50S ribosomal protein L29 [Nitrososphaerota archaeon]
MPRLKMKTIKEFNEVDLKERLHQSRIELIKFQIESSKGTLKKNSGKIKPLKKEIARLMTQLTKISNK